METSHPIFYSDIETRRVHCLDPDGQEPKSIEALRRKIQLHLPVVMVDGWKYAREDQAYETSKHKLRKF